MKQINWKKLVNQIPHKVQIANKIFYEICWVERFDNPEVVGLTNSNKREIYLKIDQSNKEKVLTYLHELMHAFSIENEIDLTEKQVSLLEKKCLYYCLKHDNLFSKEKK